MICRAACHDDFTPLLRYMFKKNKNAELIFSTLSATDPRGMACELKSFSASNPRCRRPAVHHIFSLGNGERLSLAQWAELSEQYAKWFGIDLCVGALHGDTAHQHGHFASSRVTLNGKTWSLSYERIRLREFCRAMEENFGLVRTPARSVKTRINKDELEQAARLHREGKTLTPVPERLAIGTAVKAALKQCPSLAAFEAQLLRQNISTRWKYDEQGRPIGVSFSRGEAAISGRHAGVSCKVLTLHYGATGTVSDEQTRSIGVPGGVSVMGGAGGDPYCRPLEGRPSGEHTGIDGIENTTPRPGRNPAALLGVAAEPIKEVGSLLCRALQTMATMCREDGDDADRFLEAMQRRAIRKLIIPRIRPYRQYR
jgi:hypothetical protein